MPHTELTYIDESALCFTRQKKGQGFIYLDEKGRPVKDQPTLERIKGLVIPPNWENVSICGDEWGHIQAVGYDARGRKQYRYHTLWSQQQSQHKFKKMLEFGEVLPTLRQKVNADMQLRGLPPERVIATVIWLLENTFIRVGNDEYARDNQSYGLTTLREKHVELHAKSVQFEFKGKSGVYHTVDVQNPLVARTIQKCVELPGYEIFQYLDDNGQKQRVDSRTVNDYLRTVAGEDFSAKDFRTWGGTVLAASTLYDTGVFESETQAKKNIVGAVKQVASHLRNKPSTCRKYYIHPTVIDTYSREILIPYFNEAMSLPVGELGAPRRLHKREAAAWALMKKYPVKLQN